MHKRIYIHNVLLLLMIAAMVDALRHYSKKKVIELREEVRTMFHHAYDGYLRYASDYDELRPLTCDGVDTWGSYSLTLIDALDTLATMGNFSEFRRVALLLETKIDFNKDINVSVFETNIRVLGGLLSAHLLSKRADLPLDPGWPCQGPLLRLAEDVARRLLPAFETTTGMPYGTVNLRYGVPKGETPVTCTAGVGTFLVEFGTLSRLTGNPIYEEVALNAVYALWRRRSPIGLFGNHIDVQSGRWTAVDAGIGAGVDSFFEYIVKGAILLNRPNLLEMFHEARRSIDEYLKRDDWYIWASMSKGQMTLPIFQSLDAFWPSILSIIGDTGPAIRTMSKYNRVWRQYGFLPEFYNILLGEAAPDRESYPLRPELAESAMYLYRATKNQFLLEVGENMLRSIEFSAKTKCGYATIRNVVNHEKENRMESFFLAETTKYLYLLFDEENFLHNDGSSGERLETDNGDCVIHAGAYIFNTEAHPIDMSSLYCCHGIHEDVYDGLDLSAFSDNALLKADRDNIVAKAAKNLKYQCADDVDNSQFVTASQNNTNDSASNSPVTVDIEVYDEDNNPAADILINNFERIKNERQSKEQDATSAKVRNQLTVVDLNEFFDKKREAFESPQNVLIYIVSFMENYTLDAAFISGLQILDKDIISELGAAVQKAYESRMRTLWELYHLKQQLLVNAALLKRLDNNHELLENVLKVLNNDTAGMQEDSIQIVRDHMKLTQTEFELAVVNTTAMQEFLLKILKNGTAEKKRSFKPILNQSELGTLILPTLDAVGLEKLYANVRRFVEFKIRMIQTFERLQSLIEEKEKLSTKTTVLSDTKTQDTKNDDLIVATERSETQQKNSEESTTKDDPKATPNKVLGDQLSSPNETDDRTVDSVWSQLVQTILRKTTTQRRKFDEKLLFQETRKSLEKYGKKPMRYEIFTCQRPTFVETFAYREFYP